MIGTWRPRQRGLAILLTEFVVRGGLISGAGLTCRVAMGRAGVVARKQEGDGGTPAGRMALVRVFYRADRVRPPACGVPVEPIAVDDGWCDDAAEPAYNKKVRLPFTGSHEALWRGDGVYDIVGVLDWNFDPVVPGRGSAIFLHVAAPDFAPTAGCLALGEADLRACLAASLTSIAVVGV